MTAVRKTTTGDAAQRIVAAIDSMTTDDLKAVGVWHQLDELSARTELEAIGIDESSVVLSGDRFEAVADLYLLLDYDPSSDASSLSETVLATIRGIVTNDRVEIGEMTVDTGSFYA